MKKMLFALALATSAATPVMGTELLTNGNFETGTFTGWTVTGTSGSFYIDQPGTTTPASSHAAPANSAGGNYYAVSDQTGQTIATLRQGFTVASGTTSLVLTFQMMITNWSNGDTTPGSGTPASDGTLNAGTANQYARVDILTAGASATSTTASDIVQNLYTGGVTQGWTDYSFNLTNLAAGSYQLRFAQDDQNFYFNQGVDNVSLQSQSAVPEPATWGLMLVGFGFVGGALRRQRSSSIRFV